MIIENNIDKNKKIFLNLTNGLEYKIDNNDDNLNVVRIRSTDLEQHLFNRLLMELDYNFLYHLAIGNPILVIDYSSRKKISRALFQGIPFIEYVLNKVWFDIETDSMVRNHNVTKYFGKEFTKIDKEVINKIKYFKKILNHLTPINISVWCGKSKFDGKIKQLNDLLNENIM